MFLTLGIFNIVDGIVALANDDFFKADELLFGDLSMWGAIFSSSVPCSCSPRS